MKEALSSRTLSGWFIGKSEEIVRKVMEICRQDNHNPRNRFTGLWLRFESGNGLGLVKGLLMRTVHRKEMILLSEGFLGYTYWNNIREDYKVNKGEKG